MPNFKYIARDSSGKVKEGRLEAASQGEVAVYLSKLSMLPLEIKETSSRQTLSIKDFANLEINFSKTAGSEELLAFSRNMSTMLGAGVPVLRALEQLAMHVKTQQFQKVLMTILESVKSGKTLSDAMKDYESYFPHIYISAIEIGENSGNLDTVFGKLAEFLEMEDKNSKRLTSALRYPKMVVGAMLVAIFVINIVVVPSFKTLFMSFGSQLPTPTRILVATSNFLMDYWYLIIIAVIALYLTFKNALKNKKVLYMWDKLKFTMPVLGPLVRKIMLTRFVWALSLMIKSGVALPKCIDLVAASTGNTYLEKKIRDIKVKIETSKTLSEAMREADLFDPVTMQMLYIGDETGKLDDMLGKISEQFDEETEYELKKFSDMIEPILLVVLGIMVAILALAVFLPLWDMGKVALDKQ